MALSIHSVNHYIPDNSVTVDEAFQEFGLSEQQKNVYSRFYGLNRIPVAKESIVDMLIKVTKPVIDNINCDRVKFVMAPRTAPIISLYGESVVRDVANKLGLKNAVTFAVGMNKCVSTIRAFELTELLLSSCEDSDLALIITGETVVTEQHRILPNITITGDGSGAVLLSKANSSSDHQLKAISHKIYGKYSKGIWMSLEMVSEFGNIFNQSMSDVIKAVLDKAGLNYHDIKLIFPHNVNLPCWKGFAKFEDIPPGKIYLNNVNRYSHCYNSDLIINLSTALQEKCLIKGDYYIMATVGVGAMFGAALYQY